ncbi:uncharacterized protein LOC132031571 [Lycium ferocissimum]|uniref:uncharacterized protein LOC132031571 n=1 Tax=Lycium ferocissimum TaxID=112874 RepID=UPI002815A2A0|nr:uncharacterized protein LOC132031571 [Lycium ferocissimum]
MSFSGEEGMKIEKLKNINWDIIDDELNWILPRTFKEKDVKEETVVLDDKQVTELMPRPSKKLEAGSSAELTRILDKRHPFETDFIMGPHDISVFDHYSKWICDGLLAKHEQRNEKEEHYKKNKSTVPISMDLGIQLITKKNWFYLLSFNGQMWNDEHIDVIFYYLRKKGKYDGKSTYKHTTVACIFKIWIGETFDKYVATNGDTSVAKEEDVICEYLRGYKLIANVPWHTVDNVLIPVNVKDIHHWVLAVVSFRDRCIRVYDSYRLAGYDTIVKIEIDKMAKILPQYLSISDFYRKREGIDWSQEPAYNDKALLDSFDVVCVDNLPQQRHGSKDCGVYVVAYAEYLSWGAGIPIEDFDVNLLRTRYGALLWNYGMRKQEDEAISHNEAPPKLVRPNIHSDICEKIIIN